MKSSIQIKLPIMLLLTLLVGCAMNPEQCNSTNRDASVVKKFRCLDAYETNVNNTRIELENSQQINEQFKAVHAALEKEKNEVSSELKRSTSEYTALNSTLNKLLNSVSRSSKNNSKLQSKIASIRQELKSLKTNKNASMSVMEKQQRLNQLTQHFNELQQAMDL